MFFILFFYCFLLFHVAIWPSHNNFFRLSLFFCVQKLSLLRGASAGFTSTLSLYIYMDRYLYFLFLSSLFQRNAEEDIDSRFCMKGTSWTSISFDRWSGERGKKRLEGLVFQYSEWNADDCDPVYTSPTSVHFICAFSFLRSSRRFSPSENHVIFLRIS